MSKAGHELSEEQRALLAGSLAGWLDHAYEEGKKERPKPKFYMNLDGISKCYNISPQTINRIRSGDEKYAKDFPEGKYISPQIRLWSNIAIEKWLDENENN